MPLVLALALGATWPTPPDHSLDGVYGTFPLPGEPVVQLDGDRALLGVGTVEPREARVHVQPDARRLTLTDDGRTWSFAYEVRDGVLILEVPQDDPDDPRLQAVGPVGRIPAADQRGRSGMWWAAGVPGTTLSAHSWPEGWLPPGWGPDTSMPHLWSREIGGPVSVLEYSPHPPMGQPDYAGRVLWFLATDGRLFVYHGAVNSVRRGDPVWADLVRVQPVR